MSRSATVVGPMGAIDTRATACDEGTTEAPAQELEPFRVGNAREMAPADARELSRLFFARLRTLEEGTREYQYTRNTLIEMNLSLVQFAARRFRARVLGGGMAPAVVTDARRTHPTLIEQGRDLLSPAYTQASRVSADCDRPLPEPDSEVLRLAYSHGELAQVREHAEGWARGTALTPARRGDLILAISEAAANSLSHGGGKGTLRLWSTGRAGAGAGVVAEVRDRGRLADPLAGRRRPSLASAKGGRGLWMIHQLCDLVEVRATDRGFTLRLHMATP